MNKTLKPIFKNNEKKVIDWIIEKFPVNYQELNYIEPFNGNLNIIINKEKSNIEIINNINYSYLNIFRALRDESSEFIKRLNLHKNCEDTFKKCLNKKDFEDYLEEAVNEYIKIKMSRGENKKTFLLQKNWKEDNKKLSLLSERIHNIYLLDIDPVELINKFNTNKSLIFLSNVDKFNLLNSYKGKIIACINKQNNYKKNYKNWNIHKNPSFDKILITNY